MIERYIFFWVIGGGSVKSSKRENDENIKNVNWESDDSWEWVILLK